MRKIESLKQLDALIGETYMYAIIFAIIAIVVAFIIGLLIKYQGGKNPKDHIVRRIWFFIIGIVTPIGFFLYNALYVSSYINKAPLQAKFSIANIYTTLILLGIYLAVGIFTMMIMRRTKWGTILGKSKK
jgi:hypothetical protein